MKCTDRKGFTLMEMLIVVAIIAILVAIAIPTMTSSLEKSREAADAANICVAYEDIMNRVLVMEDTSVTNAGAYTLEMYKKDGTTKTTSNDEADKYVATVTLTQKQAGWQNTSITNIVGTIITHGDGSGAGDLDKVEGGAKVKVTYTASKTELAFEVVPASGG